MISEKLNARQIELLIKLAKLLKEYDASFECEDLGSIDIDMYIPSDDNTDFDMETIRLPDSFSNYDIGELIEEKGQMKAVKAMLDAEQKGLYEELFILPEI